MDTYTHVKNAFYSGEHAFTGDKQIIRDIAFLVSKRYLELQLFPIASRQEYLTMVHDIGKNVRADEASGGSTEHIALKLWDELKNFLDFWESEKHADILRKLKR